MNPLWLLVALVLGIFAQQLRLPPLVGFLIAGFTLHALGIEGGPALEKFADLGVTLLLFTIGLKLRLHSLLAPEVWATATAHMALTIVLISGVLLIPGLAGLVLFGSLDWQAAAVIAFALSFSSTVFAVKILEDRGEMKTRHGQVAIGILVIQDIIAVVFMTFATDKLPTLWALALLGLPLLRPVLNHLMQRSGHGEVLVLFGMFMAIGGGELFELVGLKAGLGALAFGVLLSGQRKSSELSRALLSFKDLFLIGFFLSIGINALPDLHDISIAVILVVLILPLKILLFFWLMTRLQLRVRTSFLGTVALANYSEFGLIVAAVGVGSGWIDQHWLVIIAMALSFSFIIGSIFNANAHNFYRTLEHLLHRFESRRRLQHDVAPDLGNAEILIAGMGRVGSGAYLAMRGTFGDKVCGVDADADKITWHKQQGHKVVLGDAEDADFWRGIETTRLRLVMLAMPKISDMLQAVTLLKEVGYDGTIAAVTKYEDHRAALEAAGVQATFNIYAEAGTGFASHVHRELEQSGLPLVDDTAER